MHEIHVFPAELTGDIPRIVMTGRDTIHIEQHRGLMAYQQDEITLKTGIGLLRLQGKEMRFRLYSANEAIVYGEIDRVYFVGGEQNERDHALAHAGRT